VVTLALVAGAAFVAATVQSATGIGFALLLGPVAFAVLDPLEAIVLVTVPGLALNALMLGGERRRPRVTWAEVAPILAAAVPGAVAGVLVLRALPAEVLQIGVGAAVVGAALAMSRARGGDRPGSPGSSSGRLGVGFLSGALSTSTGVSGPPIALWLGARGLAPGVVRDSLAAAFAGLGLITAAALAPLVIAGEARPAPALLAVATAAVLTGHALGRRVFVRLTPGRHRSLLLGVIAIAGAASVVAGGVALLDGELS